MGRRADINLPKRRASIRKLLAELADNVEFGGAEEDHLLAAAGLEDDYGDSCIKSLLRAGHARPVPCGGQDKRRLVITEKGSEYLSQPVEAKPLPNVPASQVPSRMPRSRVMWGRRAAQFAQEAAAWVSPVPADLGPRPVITGSWTARQLRCTTLPLQVAVLGALAEAGDLGCTTYELVERCRIDVKEVYAALRVLRADRQAWTRMVSGHLTLRSVCARDKYAHWITPYGQDDVEGMRGTLAAWAGQAQGRPQQQEEEAHV